MLFTPCLPTSSHKGSPRHPLPQGVAFSPPPARGGWEGWAPVTATGCFLLRHWIVDPWREEHVSLCTNVSQWPPRCLGGAQHIFMKRTELPTFYFLKWWISTHTSLLSIPFLCSSNSLLFSSWSLFFFTTSVLCHVIYTHSVHFFPSLPDPSLRLSPLQGSLSSFMTYPPHIHTYKNLNLGSTYKRKHSMFVFLKLVCFI